MFIDSHCHLEMESFDKDRKAVVARALSGGVGLMVTVGTEEKYFSRVTDIVDAFPQVYGALGIHPHNAPDFTPTLAQTITASLRHEKIVAYGEIGLDFFRNYAPREAQLRAFEGQIEVALNEGLPIIVHSRNAAAETLEVLRRFYPHPAGGVIHCYSYDRATAREMLDLGFFISIPGTVTYARPGDTGDVVRYIPEDRLLTETDAPFLTPHPFRGRRNEPAYVRHTMERIASLKARPLEELSAAVAANIRRAFRFPDSEGSR